MPYLPPALAAERLGISRVTLRERSRKTGSPKRRGSGHGTEYLIEDTTPGRLDASDVVHDDDGGHGPAYVFDKERDRYIFSLRSKAQAGRPFVVPGDTIRAAILAYSRDGSAATWNEISRTNGWHRTTTREIMRALGKTHDSAPFSDEDIAERSEDELGEDLIRLKEERVLRKAERKSWEETKTLADKARNFDRFIAKRIEEVIAAGNFRAPANGTISTRILAAKSPFTAVFGLTDLHFGSAGWFREVGVENNLEIVRTRAIATTKRLIERVTRFGRPSAWLVPVGSDNFHADTDAGTTTKGTVLDCSGSFARMYLEGCALYEELIALLRAVAPVQLITMPGNHDRVASMMCAHWLSARYRSEPDVTVTEAASHRTYRAIGKTLVGLTHGDTVPDNRMPLVMATEAADLWGASKHRVIFEGHLHTEKSDEYAGVKVIHMASLASPDRWHYRQAYTTNVKAISAYLVDHEEGLIASLPVQPPAPSAKK